MKKTSEKGITLIALIVTVVLLLILVAVSIDFIIDGSMEDRTDQLMGKLDTHDTLMGDIRNEVRNQVSPEEIEIVVGTDMVLKIKVSNITWSGATITATVSNVDEKIINYTLEINGNTYGPGISNTWNVTGLQELTTYNFTVKATDGIETVEGTGSFTTIEMPNNIPVIKSCSLNYSGLNSSYVTYTASDADGDSLDATLYIWSTDSTDSFSTEVVGSWNGSNFTTGATGKASITGLALATKYAWYLKVTDGRDTVQTDIAYFTTPSNASPVIVANEDYKSEKTTYSFAIEMSATDADNDNLTYTLYASTSENGTYYSMGTTTASSGESKVITVRKINGSYLTQYTPYWWYIEVSDGTEIVESEKKTLKTYCPGGGDDYEYCSGGYWDLCSTCGGVGFVEVSFIHCSDCMEYVYEYPPCSATEDFPCEHGSVGDCGAIIGGSSYNCEHGSYAPHD